MPITDFRPKFDIWTGVAVGVAIVAAPVVIPMVAAAARPLLKAGLKGAYLLYEKARETGASVKEMSEDLIEEVKTEVNAELTQSDQA